MSRIGKKPVAVPSGVEVKVAGQTVSAKGKLGQLSVTVHDDVAVAMEGNVVTLKPRVETRRAKSMWGTSRTLVNNIVSGVANGFTEQLEINGVGYRAAVQGKDLVLQLGYSHEVRYPVPAGIAIKCDKPTSITISGADKQQVGQVAAEIRSYRGPEPYKGKGIKYESETILRKEGKKK
jgi:large subunit ribosomal protein L6